MHDNALTAPAGISIDIEDHLRSFGILHFDDESYWAWGGERLGPKIGKQLDRVRRPLERGNATTSELRRFYDLAARSRISTVVHSMKADAIRATGKFIEARLPLSGRIIDLGSSIGHLTTYFAACGPDRELVGYDYSAPSVLRATREADTRSISNVDFQVRDIVKSCVRESIVAACSAQTIGSLENRANLLNDLAVSIADRGPLVCVEALATAAAATAFIEEARAAQFSLTEFQFVFFSDLGRAAAYPAMTFRTDAEPLKIDIKRQYESILTMGERGN